MGTGHYAGCSCSACIDAERSDACRTCVTDSYFDEGFAAANYLRFCDSWIAIGLAATLELVIDDTPPWEPPRPRGVARNAIARRLGIPAAEAK